MKGSKMKKYKPFQSLIAIVLVVITVFSTVSISAEPLSEAVKAEQATSDNIDEGNAPAEFLEEEIEKREEKTKYFKMSDGTIQAAQYSVPVHFEQDGKWVDYDYIPYKLLRIHWQNAVLKLLRRTLTPKEKKKAQPLLQNAYSKNAEGFYVNAPKRSRANVKVLLQYISRYMKRGPIALERIIY